MLSLLLFYSVVSIYHLRPIYAFSACDEIDITLLVDVKSALSNGEDIIRFISSIIQKGSSEHSTFSAVLYGDDFPRDQRIKMLSLENTASTTVRQQMIAIATEKLATSIRNLGRRERAKDESMRSIGLVTAFKIATGQRKPKHAGARKKKLGYSRKNKNIGRHDNQQVYIVFDSTNHLISQQLKLQNAANGGGGGCGCDQCDACAGGDGMSVSAGDESEMCALFAHLDANQIVNDDEAVYFMLGHNFDVHQVRGLQCNGRLPAYIRKNTFFRFSSSLVKHERRMERVYQVTCPADIASKRYKGGLTVGNRVQYVDNDVVMECALYYYDHDHNPSTPDKLDVKTSYFKVRDYINDDNTFQVDDSMVIAANVFQRLKSKGCNAAATTIVRIVDEDPSHVYNTQDTDQGNDYKVLKVFVELAKSPMQYMSNADVHGDVLFQRKSFGRAPHDYDDHYDDEDEDGNFEDDGARDIAGDADGTADYDDDDGDGYDRAQLVRFGDTMMQQHEEDIEFDEAAIARGEMDTYAEDNPILQYLAGNIIRHRMERIQKLMALLARTRKMHHRILYQHRKHLLHRHAIFGAQLMEQEFLGKIGGFFKKAYHHVKKKVMKVVNKVKRGIRFIGNLFRGKIEEEERRELVNFSSKKDWTFLFSGEKQKVFGGKKPNGFKLTIKGEGTLELKLGYWFKLKLGGYFKFKWEIFKWKVYIEFKVYGEWDIGAYFYAKFAGKISALAENILWKDKLKVFFIGPVPVVVRPFVEIGAEFVTLPFEVYGGFRCQYKERIELGYRYCNKGCKKGPIRSRVVSAKGCTKKFGVGDENEHKFCPTYELGFDVKLYVRIGCVLYEIIGVFVRLELVIPFRMMLPELDPLHCRLPRGTDMCQVNGGRYMKVSFSLSLHLNIYLGVRAEIANIFSFLMKLMKKKGGSKSMDSEDITAEVKLNPIPIPIIPQIWLGCLNLKGLFAQMNSVLVVACCPPPPAAPPNPYSQYPPPWQQQYPNPYANPYALPNPYANPYQQQNPYQSPYANPYQQRSPYSQYNQFGQPQYPQQQYAPQNPYQQTSPYGGSQYYQQPQQQQTYGYPQQQQPYNYPQPQQQPQLPAYPQQQQTRGIYGGSNAYGRQQQPPYYQPQQQQQQFTSYHSQPQPQSYRGYGAAQQPHFGYQQRQQHAQFNQYGNANPYQRYRHSY